MRCPSCGAEKHGSGPCPFCGPGPDGQTVTVGVLTPSPVVDSDQTQLSGSLDAPAMGAPVPPPATPPHETQPSAAASPSSAGHAAPSRGPTGPLAPGEAFGGRYHIIRLLGMGGMGAVYQAWDDELGIAVAVKVIRPEITEDPAAARDLERRFKRELLLARQVTHKNVVRIHDLGEIEGIKYLTMPYVQGSDLSSILKREGKLNVERALALARQVAAGLRAAHDVGVVHRDLKPANVMIDVDDQALIMDFGIARSVSGDGATAMGAVVGTLEYMAPEQAMGQSADQRADIYAFGLILYDMLVGRRHVSRAESAVAALMERMKQAPPSIRTIDAALPEALDRIISRCVEPDPANRYQTTADLCADLEALNAQGVALRPLETAARPPIAAPRAIASRPMLVGLAAGLLVIAAGVVAVVQFARDPADVRTGAGGPALALAILPFGNATGDPSLDSLGLALADMVRTELGQSDGLRLVPADRVHQILRDLRIAPAAGVDAQVVRRVAEFTSADTIVAGQYFKLGTQFRLAASIHDRRRGTPVSLAADAAGESELLAAVGSLTRSIRENLALSPEVVTELQARSLKPSSQSVQALRMYSEGVDLQRGGAHQEAITRFQAATDADPNFALAFSRLGQTYHTMGFGPDAEKSSRQAVNLSEQVSAEERYLIRGIHGRITGDLDNAIDAFENLARTLSGDSQVQFELARLYEERGRFEDAHATLTRVLEQDPKYLDALVALGRVEIRRGQPQAGLEVLIRAHALAVQLENDEIRAAILQAHGVAYGRLNKPDEALRYYRESLELRRRFGQQRGIADSLQAIAQIETALGQGQSALKNFREALEIRRAIGDKRGTGNLLIDLGNLHADRREHKEALTFYNEALQIQREVGNQTYEGMALNNIGNMYLSTGDYDQAQTYLERALTLREKINVPGPLADTLHNLAEVNVRLGAFDRGLDRYLKALQIRRDAGDKLGTAIELSSLAKLFSHQGRYGAALNSAEEAAGIIRELGTQNLWLPRILDAYGSSLSQAGRYADAESPLNEALESAREHRNEELQARILANQGSRFFYQGQMASARRLYQQAAATASGAKAREQEAIVRLRLAELDLHEGHAQRAASALRGLEKQSDSFAAAHFALLAAEVELRLGRQSRARELLQAAVASAERLGARTLAARGHFLLISLLEAGGQKADASRHREKARELLEEIRKDARTDEVLQRADLKPIGSALAK